MTACNVKAEIHPTLTLKTHPECVREYAELKAAADILSVSTKQNVELMVPPVVGAQYMLATSKTQDILTRSPMVIPAGLAKIPCGREDVRCIGCPFHSEQSIAEHVSVNSSDR